MAQAPIANFSASVTSGCSPLIVTFTDQSSGTITNWNWDFGSVIGLRSGKGPIVISFPAGTYSATLTVIGPNGVGSITKTNLIVSNPSPSINISADRQLACLPATIQFTDLSVPNAGTISSRLWTFYNPSTPTIGGTSTVANPQYSYTSPGYYDIDLAVTNSTGCSNHAYFGRYIRVVNGVKADFDFTGPVTCQPPYAVQYKNQTSGPGNLTYAWDLGNGSTPTQTSPNTLYNTPGVYTVKLKAQSDIGCSDSIKKDIPINGITTSFNAGTDSVCLGSPAVFTNTSSPLPIKAFWDFGDGSTSNQVSPPPKMYAAAGIYPVKLTGTFTNCKDSVTKNIHVFDKPVVDFYANNAANCKAPYTVSFQNLSPAYTGAQWSFGDGGTSTSTAAVVNHTYLIEGTFTVTLTITDSRGCTNTVSKEVVHILPPVAYIGGLPGGLCTGQSFTPYSNSGSYDGIVGYLWDFGDGTTSNSATPSHSYVATGNKTVTLTVTTTGGCTASASGVIVVGAKPTINFTADKFTGCSSDSIRFTNLSTPAGYSNVFWDFGDNTSSISLANPLAHKFADTGLHNIMLKLTSNGCTDSLTKTNLVYTQPPAANFGYKIADCLNKTNVTFIDSSETDPTKMPLTYLWSFGDPANTTSPVVPPAPVGFIYPAASQSYTVKLKVTNGVCVDSATKKIQLVNETAKFTTNKPAFCRNEKITLTSGNTTALIKKYQWVIDGGAPVDGNKTIDTSFASIGNHTLQLLTTDINDCPSSSPVQSVAITGPTASFGILNNGGCKNSALTFTDGSTPAGTITKWTFDFGDGVVKSFTSGPFTHAYADTGNYSVKLTVNDIGCSDTFRLMAPVIVTKPRAGFSAESTVYCPGATLQFTDSSQGNGLSYLWNFGDGAFANSQNPTHAFANNANPYTVKLIVTDNVGCADTLTKNSYISIKSPKASFTVKDTFSFCPPLETKFVFTGQNYTSFGWNFGDSPDTISKANTSHFYNNYGNYTATLYAYGNGGCVDSASVNIRVPNPADTNYTSVNFDPKVACNELLVNFTIKAPLGAAYQLDFGDGGNYKDSVEHSTTQHFYNLPNLYSPVIILSDNTGCQAYVGVGDFVNIKGAVPIFSMDKKAFCDSGTVNFTDYSQDGRDPIVKRTWDFGDGQTQVAPGGVVHKYTTPGLYPTALTVTASSGCEKTYNDTVRVLATPTPIINSADGICTNLIVDFKGTLLVPPDTATTWKWDLSGGRSSTQQNVSVNYPDTGLHHITLEATNSLGCKGSTSKDIVIYPLPVIAVAGDTTLLAGAGGETIPLTYSANATAFSWTPATNLSCTDCSNPFANPKFTTTYNVKVTDANGCISSRNLTLIVLCNDKNFFIPNTFSPNNDGANDRFYPRGKGLDRIQALRIFNRWGELVFEKRNFPANDAASGWDGTYKGKTASSDTYVYMIDIICENAVIITYKGNITLIR